MDCITSGNLTSKSLAKSFLPFESIDYRLILPIQIMCVLMILRSLNRWVSLNLDASQTSLLAPPTPHHDSSTTKPNLAQKGEYTYRNDGYRSGQHYGHGYGIRMERGGIDGYYKYYGYDCFGGYSVSLRGEVT